MIQMSRYRMHYVILGLLATVLLVRIGLGPRSSNDPMVVVEANRKDSAATSTTSQTTTATRSSSLANSEKATTARVNNSQEQQQQLPPQLPAVRRSPAPKTLIVVMGSLRGGELAWHSLYKNLLEATPGADLAVLTEDPAPAAYQNSSLFDRAKYVWKVPKYEDWTDAMDLVHNTSAWREPLFRLYRGGNNTMLGGINNIRASGAIVFMFRWFLAQRLQQDDGKLLWKYNRFVVTRSDHYYLCPHDVRTLNVNYIWVPAGEDYKGICDRHLVAGRKYILKALDMLPPLLLHPEKYYKQLTHRKYSVERFLKHRWAEEGLLSVLQRFPRNMFTCAIPAHDTSQWSMISDDPVKEGVHIKYITEYDAAHETCSKQSQEQEHIQQEPIPSPPQEPIPSQQQEPPEV